MSFMVVGRQNGKIERLIEEMRLAEKMMLTTSFGFPYQMKIKKVIFHGPATIVIWADDSKTVVKCMDGEDFDLEKGLAMAICKRVYGPDFHSIFKKYVNL